MCRPRVRMKVRITASKFADGDDVSNVFSSRLRQRYRRVLIGGSNPPLSAILGKLRTSGVPQLPSYLLPLEKRRANPGIDARALKHRKLELMRLAAEAQTIGERTRQIVRRPEEMQSCDQ